MLKLLYISLFIQSCQKQLNKIPKGDFASVKFYTSYVYLSGANLYVKNWEVAKYDTPFCKLKYALDEPYCSDTTFQTFKAARGRYYSIEYFDKDADYLSDTAFMIPVYNSDECVFIDLNN